MLTVKELTPEPVHLHWESALPKLKKKAVSSKQGIMWHQQTPGDFITVKIRNGICKWWGSLELRHPSPVFSVWSVTENESQSEWQLQNYCYEPVICFLLLWDLQTFPERRQISCRSQADFNIIKTGNIFSFSVVCFDTYPSPPFLFKAKFC